jgi:drug/metabolite transporter (DMT)-like permease
MPYLLISLCALFWASNFIAAKILGSTIPPITLTLLRWLAVFILLTPVTAVWIYKNINQIKRHAFYLIAMGLLSITLFNSLLYIGIQDIQANKSAILQSTTPIVILLLCGFALKENITPRQWLGVTVSFLGVVALIVNGDISQLGQMTFAKGDLFILASVLCWAIYSIALRWRPAEIEEIAFINVMAFVGIVGLAPLTFFELQTVAMPTLNATDVLVIIYIAVFPSILAVLFWNKAVIKIGASNAGLFTHAIPIFTFALSAFFLGENVRSYHVIGLVLILTGVFFALQRNTASRITSAEN